MELTLSGTPLSDLHAMNKELSIASQIIRGIINAHPDKKDKVLAAAITVMVCEEFKIREDQLINGTLQKYCNAKLIAIYLAHKHTNYSAKEISLWYGVTRQHVRLCIRKMNNLVEKPQADKILINHYNNILQKIIK